MEDIQKDDIHPEVFQLYDAYAHNKLERRDFIEKLSVYAVGSLTVPALLSFMLPKYEENRLVSPQDDRLNSKFITYDSPKGGGEIKALLSYPKSTTGKLPGIVVVHENRGLNPYIEDVGRRAALEEFITIAPDALTPLGGYPGNDDEGRALQRQRDRGEMLEDFIAAYDYLRSHERCNGSIGVVGFCFGGSISNKMAVEVSTLGAAVPFYGGQPESELVSNIQAPLLIHYAEEDERVNAGWPAYKEALEAAQKEYEVHFYEGVKHGFHNNTTPRYDEASATLAWQRTLEFFKKHLES